MNFKTAFLLLLVIGVAQLAPADDVSHDQAVDEAVAEAELEEVPVADVDVPIDPESETEPEPEPEPKSEPEPEPEPETGDSAVPDALQPNLEDTIDEPVPAAADVDYSDDEVIALPHLPEAKYDQEGDLVWFPRIIGGSRAQLGEFPSKVSLQTRSGSHFCGGNLITDNHIISAAHCVVTEDGILLNPASIEIMAGDITITRNPGRHRVHRIVSHIFVHTKYDSHTMDNDIAILRVSVPFHPVDGILIPEPLALSVPVTGTVCSLAGWGATSEGSNNASPNLMRVNLEIVDTNRCNTSYQGMIGANMFCAGTMQGGRDACQGDSGGGLMCHGVITGIVSFGFGCGRPRFPGVYMDVSAYTDFIENSLNFEGTHNEIPQPDFMPGSALSVHKTSLGLLLAVLVYIFV